MSKKLEILGMALDNDTVQEAMLKVEGFLDSTMMKTVGTISMETLVKAQEDGQLKECIESLELTIISDKEILKAAEETSQQRIIETTDNIFMKEFLGRAAQNRRRAYLLGDTTEQLHTLEDYLSEHYEGIIVSGSYALMECVGDYDTVINEINIAEPDVIFSVISTPEQEYFLKANREKLNVKIWYGLGNNYASKKGVSEVAGFAKKLIQKSLMHSLMARYHKKEE